MVVSQVFAEKSYCCFQIVRVYIFLTLALLLVTMNEWRRILIYISKHIGYCWQLVLVYIYLQVRFKPGMWKSKPKLETVEAVKFLWKRKHFEERSWNWKRKRTRKHLTFWGAGIGSIFHKMWRRMWWKRLNFCGSGSTLKKEAGSGSKLRSD